MNEPIKIAFLGDSVTEGCFELYPTSYGFDTVRRPDDGYVNKTIKALRKKYGEQAITYQNFGESGMSAYAATAQAERAVLYAPHIAVLSFGLNDAFHPEERYHTSLERLLERLTGAVPTVIFLTPNMMCESLAPDLLPEATKAAKTAMDAQISGKFDRMVADAIELCREYGVPVCHIYAKWKSLAEDGDLSSLLINRINHPTAQMHDMTAAMLLPLLEAAIDAHRSDERLSSRS